MSTVVIDYGCGNLTSLSEAFRRLDIRVETTSDSSRVAAAERLVLPGVGNFGHAASVLRESGLRDAIRDAVDSGTPLLGICLGMQLLFEWSEESGREAPGLALLPGVVRSLRAQGVEGRVPHIGWNELLPKSEMHPLLHSVPHQADVYFVHSFSAVASDTDVIVAGTDYEVELVAAVALGSVWGTQFHPEKSSGTGLQILRNFVQHTSC